MPAFEGTIMTDPIHTETRDSNGRFVHDTPESTPAPRGIARSANARGPLVRVSCVKHSGSAESAHGASPSTGAAVREPSTPFCGGLGVPRELV